MKYYISCASTIALLVLIFITATKCDSEIVKPDENPEDIYVDDMTNGETTKIVGGQEIKDVSKYSWYGALIPKEASFESATKVVCGSTIISCWWLLTAAHCYNERSYKAYSVILLLVNRCTNKFGYRREVTDCIIHEKYNNKTFANDIALIKTDKPMEGVQFATLPQPEMQIYGLPVIAVGTGVTKYEGHEPCCPQVVRLEVFPREQCLSYSSIGHSSTFRNNFCAGNRRGGKDTCQGDSGGPLCYRSSHQKDILVGITSYGIGCANATAPGVYTKVQNYIHWITENVLKNCCLKKSIESSSNPPHHPLTSFFNQLLQRNITLNPDS